VFLPENLWSETLSSAISVTQIHIVKELIHLICKMENTISHSLKGWNGSWWNGQNSSSKNKDKLSSCSCQDASCSLHHWTEWWLLKIWKWKKYYWWNHIKLKNGWWQYLPGVVAGIISPRRHSFFKQTQTSLPQFRTTTDAGQINWKDGGGKMDGFLFQK